MSSTTRSWTSAFDSFSWALICSAIWSPMRWTGFSDVIGSWKIIAISAPRMSRIVDSPAPSSSVS